MYPFGLQHPALVHPSSTTLQALIMALFQCLQHLQGEILALCRDQHVCMYLEKKLKEGAPKHQDMTSKDYHPLRRYDDG